MKIKLHYHSPTQLTCVVDVIADEDYLGYMVVPQDKLVSLQQIIEAGCRANPTIDSFVATGNPNAECDRGP